MRQLDEEGRYRLGAADLLTSKRCVLEGAVPPIAITQEEPVRSYGWVSKGLPTPATGGLYVVEFFGKSDIAILAYIDPFGRVFSTSEASAVPPARTPDLTFARVPQQAAGEELGCVYVHESDGSKKDVAQYRCASGRYALFDSWYDFGPYDMNLTYEDAMARAYLAFVLRPSLGAPSVPERGIGGVFERLKGDKPLTAMRSIVEDARCAEDDPVCKPPALVSCLAHWLTEAGLDKLAGVKDEALRLVRTVRYANTYYLGVEDGEAPITLWAIEAALNRFLLVSEAFGDRASMATEADCARWDAYLLETVAAQRPVMDGPADAPAAERAGEWSVRCAIGAMLERLRLPVRLDASMRFDVEAGAAAFDLKVPGASLMPSWAWREESGWVQASERDRDAQAHRYALHLGLVHSTLRLESDASTSWRGRARTRRRARATKVRESFRASRLRGRSCRRRSLGKRTRRSDASRMRAPATRCRRMRRAGRSSMWRRPKRSRTSTPFRRTSCVCRCRKWSTGRWRTTCASSWAPSDARTCASPFMLRVAAWPKALPTRSCALRARRTPSGSFARRRRRRQSRTTTVR